MARTELPFIYYGEITGISDNSKTDKRSMIRYTVLADTENGSRIVLTNVMAATLFGGIGDYAQFRSRASYDSGDELNIAGKSTQSDGDARIGDRVLISFINGNINTPMIIGYVPHPNQTSEFQLETHESMKPQGVLQYLGVKIKIDETGQLIITRKGAPTIKYTGGALGGLTGALSSISAIASGEIPNAAIEPADKEETTIIELLDKGKFRVRDAEGQVISLDRDEKTIEITNSGTKSTDTKALALISAQKAKLSESTGIPTSESIKFKKGDGELSLSASKMLKLTSGKDRKESTIGDYSHSVKKNIKIDSLLKADESALQGWKISSKAGAIELEGSLGAKIKLDKGKVGIGGKGGELVALLEDTLTQVDAILLAIQALTVGTGVGPSTPPINLPDFIKTQTQVAAIKTKVTLIKGGI